jgi:hypothetical protein
MRLIDADRLNATIEKAEEELEDEYGVIGAGSIKSIIDEQPTIFPIFSSRSSGKKAITEYVNMCRLLDDYGIDSTDPVGSLRFILESYMKVIIECTGCQMSKLTYTPEAVIACICDRQTELAEEIQENDNRKG